MSRPFPARGGAIVALGAVLALVACALPWGRTAGRPGELPALAYGFDGSGILVFIAAAVALALLALPWAAERRVPPLDGPLPLIAAAAIGAVGLLVRAVQLLGWGALGLPDRSPGLWLAAVGLALTAWGAGRVAREARPT